MAAIDRLAGDMTIAGPVSVEINTPLVETPVDLVARLTVVHDDGYRRNLTDGVRRFGVGISISPVAVHLFIDHR